MRNLKKIIAVVVTLVMLFAISSISASAAAAPVFSLLGKTETNLTVAAGGGEAQEYYELVVYLEDADNVVGAIQGVITYDPTIFVYQSAASELGAALDDGSNTLANSISCDDAGTIKFVGVSEEVGAWYVLRFTVEATGSASFGLVARGANAEGTANLTVTAKPLNDAAITDEAMINMEGGAILQKTQGLSSPKNVLTGEIYTGDKKPMKATLVLPQKGNYPVGTVLTAKDTVIHDIPAGSTVEFVNSKVAAFNYPSVKLSRTEDNSETVTNYTVNSAFLASYTKANGGAPAPQNLTGGSSLIYYLELEEGNSINFNMSINFNEADGGAYYGNSYNAIYYILPVGATEWQALKANGYVATLPEGFKGLIRLDYDRISYTKNAAVPAEATKGPEDSPYAFYIWLRSVSTEHPVYVSFPWIVEECTDEYDPWTVVTSNADAIVTEPAQELAFNVTIDSDLVAAKEAELQSEVVEVGTLLMYTKRLNYRELTLDMVGQTGLVHAKKAVATDEDVVSFITNLKNIKWNGMGVSVSVRAYIKFADGTVIYSKNFNNTYETNSGYARESVIGIAVDAVKAGEYDTAKAATLGYNVDAIVAIANQSTIANQDRIDLLNFIADCYKAN